MTSRLARADSPYLKAHAADPVDWYPWGAEAFAKANELGRPIFLSSGYSACHWCHVMQRESFRDPAIAALLNANFVSVKVDREERPDVDAAYMAALQAMTGSGGWPLSAVLTPDGQPFFAGTYWPPEARHGLPAFRDVLRALISAWESSRAEIASTAADLNAHLRHQLTAGLKPGPLDPRLTDAAVSFLLDSFDQEFAGFGSEPKFPHHQTLHFLLSRPEHAARKAAQDTLRAMARGGITDQLGGGLSRYTVDRAWRVPHYEKMLFDSAQFLELTARAFRQTGEPGFRRTALLTAGWLMGSLQAEDGTFHTAMSAESGGHEGAYYLFEPGEAREVLAQAGLGHLAEEAFGFSSGGPALPVLERRWWEEAGDPQLEKARLLLLQRRAMRTPPETDTKILTSQNGLAISGLASAGRLLGAGELISAAGCAAEPFLRQLQDGSLRHSRGGEDLLFLEDPAFLGLGLLELYNATFEPRWLAGAWECVQLVRDRFTAGDQIYSSNPDAQLSLAGRNLSDSGVPADVPEAARLCLRFARLRDDPGLGRLAENTLAAALQHAAGNPLAGGSTLRFAGEWFGPLTELVFAGQRGSATLEELAGAARVRDLPHALFLHGDAGAGEYPLLQGRTAADGHPAAWVCIDHSCLAPARSAAELDSRLARHT